MTVAHSTSPFGGSAEELSVESPFDPVVTSEYESELYRWCKYLTRLDVIEP